MGFLVVCVLFEIFVYLFAVSPFGTTVLNTFDNRLKLFVFHLFIDNERVLKASFNFVQAQRPYLSRQILVYDCIMTALFGKLVYLNGNNAAKGENNIKYANSYPMK